MKKVLTLFQVIFLGWENPCLNKHFTKKNIMFSPWCSPKMPQIFHWNSWKQIIAGNGLLSVDRPLMSFSKKFWAFIPPVWTQFQSLLKPVFESKTVLFTLAQRRTGEWDSVESSRTLSYFWCQPIHSTLWLNKTGWISRLNKLVE